MMSSLTIIVTMADYIINANKVYIMLKESIDEFDKEARIIDEAKCYLVNYENLDNFNYDGAYTYETGRGYMLIYNGLVINLEIEEKMISDYSFN